MLPLSCDLRRFYYNDAIKIADHVNMFLTRKTDSNIILYYTIDDGDSFSYDFAINPNQFSSDYVIRFDHYCKLGTDTKYSWYCMWKLGRDGKLNVYY